MRQFMEKQRLLNTYVNNMDMNEAIYTIEKMIKDKKKSYVIPINVDMVVKMRMHKRHGNCY